MSELLLLSDPAPFVDALPDLLIASGPWKPFPWANRDSLLKRGDPPATVLRTGPRRAAFEDRVARLLSAAPLAQNPLLAPADRAARRRTGLGFLAAAEPWLLRARQGRRLVEGLRRADAVAFNAGGLLSDHLARYLPCRILELHLAKRMRKPVALVNYSLALEDPLHVELAAPVLRSVDLHVVREPLSRDVLLGMGVEEGRICVTLDTAFALPPPPDGREAAGGEAAIMVRGDRSPDLDAWAELVRSLGDRFGLRVRYLVGCGNHDPGVRDALARRAPLCEEEGEFDRDALITRLREVDVLLTDRYHGVVFAVQAGTPVLPIESTTHKTRGLLAHPAIRMSVPKEPNHFLFAHEESSFGGPGADQSRRTTIRDPRSYERLFAPDPGITAFGDASVNYMPSAAACREIRRLVPGARRRKLVPLPPPDEEPLLPAALRVVRGLPPRAVPHPPLRGSPGSPGGGGPGHLSLPRPRRRRPREGGRAAQPGRGDPEPGGADALAPDGPGPRRTRPLPAPPAPGEALPLGGRPASGEGHEAPPRPGAAREPDRRAREGDRRARGAHRPGPVTLADLIDRDLSRWRT